MTGPNGSEPPPAPATPPVSAPTPAAPRISPEELRAWMDRRQRTGRKVAVVVLTVVAVVVATVTAFWTIYNRHLVASSQLQRHGFMVDWDFNLENFTTGGTTGVAYRPN